MKPSIKNAPLPAPPFNADDASATTQAIHDATRLRVEDVSSAEADRLAIAGGGYPSDYAPGIAFDEAVREGRASQFNRTLRETVEAERTAAEAVSHAARLRSDGLRLQREWEILVNEYQALARRWENGRLVVEEGRASLATARQVLTAEFGEGANQRWRTSARTIRDSPATIAILEEAMEAFRKTFAAHVETMRAFISEHGLPSDLLQHLPTV